LPLADRATARAEIFTFIETFYNHRKLRHPTWDYLTPLEIRQRHDQGGLRVRAEPDGERDLSACRGVQHARRRGLVHRREGRREGNCPGPPDHTRSYVSADFSAGSELSPTATGLIKNTLRVQAVVLDWCYGFYNHDRQHSSTSMTTPINYENTQYPKPASIALR
jgi:transposase InsO family protein